MNSPPRLPRGALIDISYLNHRKLTERLLHLPPCPVPAFRVTVSSSSGHGSVATWLTALYLPTPTSSRPPFSLPPGPGPLHLTQTVAVASHLASLRLPGSEEGGEEGGGWAAVVLVDCVSQREAGGAVDGLYLLLGSCASPRQRQRGNAGCANANS